MTLASKLLEGYYPEEGGYVLEGMTPEVMMNQVNAICTECITGLYEAAQQYFTDDIIGQAEVITEGAGIIDKIKEAIGKFIQKIKDIWAWFVKKVKAFPAWIKGLFTKSAEATAEVVQKAEKSIGINHKMVSCVSLSVVSKYESVLEQGIKILNDVSGEALEDFADSGATNAVLQHIEQQLKDAVKDASGGDYSKGNISKLGALKKLAQDYADDVNKLDDDYAAADGEMNTMIDTLDKYHKSFQENAKVEQVASTKVLSEAKNFYKKSKAVSDQITKPIQKAINTTEKTLSELNNPSYQKRLEQVFIKGYTDNGGKGNVAATASTVARTYIGATSKGMSILSASLNKAMTLSSKISAGYSAISSKLRSAVMKTKSGGEGNSDNKPAENKE